jgi:hypothetical protein
VEEIEPVYYGELWRIKKAAQTVEDYQYIQKAVKAGEMEFFRAGECYFVTCLEMPQKELVIVCCEGANLRKVMDAIRASAKQQQYKTIRVHAFNKGMIRLLNRSGYNWQQAETVYRLEI